MDFITRARSSEEEAPTVECESLVECESDVNMEAVDEPMDEDDQASSDEEAITTMMMMAELEFDRDWEGCMCEDELAAIHEATEQAKAKGLTPGERTKTETATHSPGGQE